MDTIGSPGRCDQALRELSRQRLFTCESQDCKRGLLRGLLCSWTDTQRSWYAGGRTGRQSSCGVEQGAGQTAMPAFRGCAGTARELHWQPIRRSAGQPHLPARQACPHHIRPSAGVEGALSAGAPAPQHKADAPAQGCMPLMLVAPIRPLAGQQPGKLGRHSRPGALAKLAGGHL